MRLITSALILAFLFYSCDSQNKTNQTMENSTRAIGEIIRLDPELDKLIAPGTKIEVLADGFVWTEGPLWIEDGQYLLFSDIPPNSIFKWKEGEGVSLYLKPSGYTGTADRAGEPGSNGLLLDANGNLVLCQHGDRRMARMDAPLNTPEPKFITLTDNFNGMKLNSPNDAVFHSNGDLYFTDPPYGLEKNMDDPTKEIPFQGVFRCDKDGVTHLLTDKVSRPNGIALSPDEKILYVASSDGSNPIIMSYNVQVDGSVDDGKVFFDAMHLKGEGVKGSPDGMKVSKAGIVYATCPGGVVVLDQQGKHLGTISSGEANSNVALDEKGGYLYATSDMYLIRVKLL